jgi:hypothetical protein
MQLPTTRYPHNFEPILPAAPIPFCKSAMKVELYDESISFEGLVSMISDYVTEVHIEGVSLLGNDDSALTLQKKIRGMEPF